MLMIRELDELVLGNMVFGKGIYGFHIKVENVPGVAASISQVAFNRGVNIVSFVPSISSREAEVASIFLAVDFYGKAESPSDFLNDLKQAPGVIDAQMITPKAKGNVIVDEHFFPLIFSDSRAILFGLASLSILLRELRKVFNPKAVDSLLYHSGYTIGTRLYTVHAAKVKEMGDKEALELLQAFFLGAGWGRPEVIRVSENSITLRFYDLWECEVMKGFVQEPASHYVRGIIAGYMTLALRKIIEVTEHKCIAIHSPFCEFIIRIM
ncbi:MAG: hypothetical protein DRO05_07450 [Thermoproteota archaeon]|nr:MAG: hypothetical protein DRO05_07450 [Candidatus Korarchaeota archaeon]